MSKKREPSPKNILENFTRAAIALKIPPKSVTLCNYEHGTNIEWATRAHAGMGINRETTLNKCDGLITSEPGAAVCSIHADCLPLFYADKHKRVAGCAHAGWRGTFGNMVKTAVSRLTEAGLDKKDMLFGIGPSIGPCCFQVQEDVGGLFAAEYGEDIRIFRDGNQYVNLWRVTLSQLCSEGVPPENVTLAEECTCCNETLYYSFRRNGKESGSMASMIML